MQRWFRARPSFDSAKQKVKTLPSYADVLYSLIVRTLAADTHPDAERVLIELWRRASPARKMEIVISANLTARALAMAGLRERHPGESPDRLRRRLADLWLGPDLAAKAYGPLPE